MVGFVQNFREQHRDLPILPTKESCDGKTYVVTGANTGLGFECAQHFVRLGAEKVILACRSIERGETAKAKMLKSTGKTESAIEVWQLDLGSYESVQTFAKRFETLQRVDVVVENASVAKLAYEQAEGIDSSLAVNVVGTVLLAALLLPRLQQFGKTFQTRPHLVVVGSEVAFSAGGQLEKVDGDIVVGLDARWKASMPLSSYPTTKLMQLYMVRRLAKLQAQAGSSVVINFVNPGLCKTELSREAGPVLQTLFSGFKFFMARTAEMGSRTLLHAAVAGPESHGKYLSACEIQEYGGKMIRGGEDMQERVLSWKPEGPLCSKW